MVLFLVLPRMGDVLSLKSHWLSLEAEEIRVLGKEARLWNKLPGWFP